MSEQGDKIVVGKFGASYGIRGWLKVFSYTDNAESIFRLQHLGLLNKRVKSG